MLKTFFVIFLGVFWPLIVGASDRITVVVGGYPSLPYVSPTYAPSDVTAQVIDILNDIQDHYQFIFKPISSKRRYQQMSEKRIDLIMFEDPIWEWSAAEIEYTEPFVVEGRPYQDADLYVTLKSIAQQQSFFDRLDDKTLLLTRGFHYGFAGFNADERYLEAEYNAYIVNDQETLIRVLLGGRGEVAVMTRSWLNYYRELNPQDRDKFYPSRRVDNIQNLRIIIGGHSPVGKAELDLLVARLGDEGLLDELLKRGSVYD